MADVTPHLAIQLEVVAGQFVTVEQGSPDHVTDQAEFVCRTRPGTLEADPEFGLRELVARLEPAAPQVLAALAEYVPGTEFVATETLAGRVRDVTVNIAQEEAT